MNGINPEREQRQRKDVFTQWRPQSTTLPLHMALPGKALGGKQVTEPYSKCDFKADHMVSMAGHTTAGL